MKLIASHLTVDMYGCKVKNLSDLDFIKKIIDITVADANMTLIDSSIHLLDEKNLNAIALVKEGHITIHTYPDLGYTAVDVFNCSDDSRPEKIVATIKSFLKPEKTKTTFLKRGDFGAIKDMKPKIKVSVAPFRRIRNTGARVIKLLSRKQR